MGLEALIFDVDGTLADTERDGHRVAFNLAFAESGLDWEWSVELYGELLAVTGGKERMAYYLKHYNQTFQPPQGLSLDRFIAQLHQAKTRHYVQLLSAGAIPLRSGVARLLAEARAEGLRLAISTTTTPENVDALLRCTLGAESLDWFEVIGAGDIVPAKKPAPDIYEFVLDKLNLPASACLALEDSKNGLLSARGANLETLMTLNGYTESDDVTGALLVVDQLGEPDSPMTVRQGESGQTRYVDIALLRTLHAS